MEYFLDKKKKARQIINIKISEIAIMKTFKLIFLALLVVNVTFAQLSYKGDVANLMIDFDPTYMKKYEYQTVEGYIVEESYINYHIPLDFEKTLILKIQKSTSPTSVNRYNTLKRNEIAMTDYAFVERINHNATNLYLNINNQSYKVAYTIYRTMSDNKMSYYAPPHMSFTYDYKNDHFPGDNIFKEGEGYDGYIVRHYYHGSTEVEGIQNDVLLKMYNDACYNREYGVTVPLSNKGQVNPYLSTVSKTTNKPLYRSCQHPIQSEYLKGIGLYKEFYQEGDKVYGSDLVAIDDIPINDYLKLASHNYEFANFNDNNGGLAMQNAPKAPSSTVTISENIPGRVSENIPGAKKSTIQDLAKVNTIKSPVQAFEKQQAIKASNPLSFDAPDENMMFGAPKVKEAQTIEPMLTIGPKKNVHIVQTGETLYRLAKKYDVSIEALRNLNDLKDNTIFVDQNLVVRAK